MRRLAGAAPLRTRSAACAARVTGEKHQQRGADETAGQRLPKRYYLRTVEHYQSLAYPPRLAVDLGSYVDGELYGWAWQPYGYFDPAQRHVSHFVHFSISYTLHKIPTRGPLTDLLLIK